MKLYSTSYLNATTSSSLLSRGTKPIVSLHIRSFALESTTRKLSNPSSAVGDNVVGKGNRTGDGKGATSASTPARLGSSENDGLMLSFEIVGPTELSREEGPALPSTVAVDPPISS